MQTQYHSLSTIKPQRYHHPTPSKFLLLLTNHGLGTKDMYFGHWLNDMGSTKKMDNKAQRG